MARVAGWGVTIGALGGSGTVALDEIGLVPRYLEGGLYGATMGLLALSLVVAVVSWHGVARRSTHETEPGWSVLPSLDEVLGQA